MSLLERPPALGKLVWGPPAGQICWGAREAPTSPAPDALPVSSLSLDPLRLEAGPNQQASCCFSQDGWLEEWSCFSCPHPPQSTPPPECFPVPLHAPQRTPLLQRGSRNPRRPGERWNVRCLRSEPESDLSWVEMRGKWPRTTRSFTSFPDLAVARAGLPNRAGRSQDICSPCHKAHLDPLRELRAIKFS